jgi:hypothetical protein
MATQSPRTPLIKGWNPPTVKPAPVKKGSIRQETRNKGTGKPKPGAGKGWTPGRKPGAGLKGL